MGFSIFLWIIIASPFILFCHFGSGNESLYEKLKWSIYNDQQKKRDQESALKKAEQARKEAINRDHAKYKRQEDGTAFSKNIICNSAVIAVADRVFEEIKSKIEYDLTSVSSNSIDTVFILHVTFSGIEVDDYYDITYTDAASGMPRYETRKCTKPLFKYTEYDILSIGKNEEYKLYGLALALKALVTPKIETLLLQNQNLQRVDLQVLDCFDVNDTSYSFGAKNRMVLQTSWHIRQNKYVEL